MGLTGEEHDKLVLYILFHLEAQRDTALVPHHVPYPRRHRCILAAGDQVPDVPPCKHVQVYPPEAPAAHLLRVKIKDRVPGAES